MGNYIAEIVEDGKVKVDAEFLGELLGLPCGKGFIILDREIFDKLELFRFKEAIREKRKFPIIREENIDGHPCVVVVCSPEMIEVAFSVSDAVHKTATAKKLKEHIKSTPAWRETGFLGQFAVNFYLFGKWEDFDAIKLGEADVGDVKIGKGLIANVITRSELYSPENYAIIDKVRFERNPYCLYIVCTRKTDDEVIIWGYAWFNEVLKWKIKNFGYGDCKYADVKTLHPIKELKELFGQ